MINALKEALRAKATEERKKANERYFKLAPGQYGAGDIFLGVSVPDSRAVGKLFKALPFAELAELLQSPIHEERLCAAHILVDRYKRAKKFEERTYIFDFYIRYSAGINNWDLVDTSAPHILGAYLFETQDYTLLHTWIEDDSLWRRRMALLATQYFIRQGHYDQTLALVEKVLNDREDLIHKAAGWMLRETGEGDRVVLEQFLQKHHTIMPRTMLRYAIEKFDKTSRERFL